MSGVMFKVSGVRCHVSCIIFLNKVSELVGEGFVISGPTTSSLILKIYFFSPHTSNAF